MTGAGLVTPDQTKDVPKEERNVMGPYQQQSTLEMPVGLAGYEESTTEHRHEAGNDTLQATTVYQPATAERDSPKVTHGPQQT